MLLISMCLAILRLILLSAASLILDPPVDQTVPVNSTAVFSCRVKGFLVWEIDTLEISDSRRDAFCIDRGVCVNGTLDSSPDETESVLLVAANELNNGSTIRCLASETIVSPSEASEAAVLTTFGKLECSPYKRAVIKVSPHRSSCSTHSSALLTGESFTPQHLLECPILIPWNTDELHHHYQKCQH